MILASFIRILFYCFSQFFFGFFCSLSHFCSVVFTAIEKKGQKHLFYIFIFRLFFFFFDSKFAFYSHISYSYIYLYGFWYLWFRRVSIFFHTFRSVGLSVGFILVWFGSVGRIRRMSKVLPNTCVYWIAFFVCFLKWIEWVYSAMCICIARLFELIMMKMYSLNELKLSNWKRQKE